ncbi:hypothetical protein [Roseibium sp.]|uniref:hypothetical protein n=1 Tax=Roseibium sp. TaxID=1936156 RepID=UPI00391CC1F1
MRTWLKTLPLLTALAGCADDPDIPAEDTPEAPTEGAQISPEDEPFISYKADGIYTLPAQPLEDVVLPTPGEMVHRVMSPAILRKVEETGLSFGHVLTKAFDGSALQVSDNDSLHSQSSWYRSIVSHLSDALDDIEVGGDYTYGAEPFVNRLFNKGWLTSKDAHFELIGVVNRLDRLGMYVGTEDFACGEVRLLYRLAYQRDDIYSRMPFVFNVIYEVQKPLGVRMEVRTRQGRLQVCQQVVKQWLAPQQNAEGYVRWVQDRVQDERLRLRQVEVNFQAVRVPSESKDDLGGHAEYIMRIFRPEGDQMMPAPLENTPDVARLTDDLALKANLKAYIAEHLEELDDGVMQLPEEFLAREVTSFTTHGLHRPANRRFSAIFSPSELADLDLSKAPNIQTAEGLLMRLDDMTCAGCHQGRSVAGFHVLGEDRMDLTHPLNAVRLPGSPHFEEEDRRRDVWLNTLAAGQAPERHRPLSFEPFSGAAPAGAPCVPSAADHFASPWRCDEGLSCRVTMDHKGDDDTLPIGVCVRPTTTPVAGDACYRGDFTADDSDPRRDTMTRRKRFGCQGYACLAPVEGTPGGLCYAHCLSGNRARNDDELCAYNGGATFDACAESGNWAGCIIESTRRGLRAACDESTPCRDDYICQRFFEFDGNGVKVPEETRGYCVPNYFLYQLRLDGHPHDP